MAQTPVQRCAEPECPNPGVHERLDGDLACWLHRDLPDGWVEEAYASTAASWTSSTAALVDEDEDEDGL